MFGLITQVQKKYSIHAGLFVFSAGLRVIIAFAISLASGLALRDLAVFYDGHIYILIAKTLPHLYFNLEGFFPTFPEHPAYITGWFPVYPAFIRLVSLFTGELQLSALITAWLAGGIAVVLFYELAKGYLEKPLVAATLFSFLPTAWLICGSLAFVESTYACLLLACILALQRGRTGWAMLFAALTVITQKTGFLLLPILVFAVKPRLRALLPCISGITAIITLQLYLWWLFGDPLINVRVAKAVFGGGNGLLGFPFAGFCKWMLDSGTLFQGMFWVRKFIIILETTFYIFVLLWALRRRSPRMIIFMVWLGIMLLFHASLPPGFFSFYAFPRFMSIASPAAIMLGCYLFPVEKGRWTGASILLFLAVLWTVLDGLSAVDLCYRVWTPDYFSAFVRAIKL